MPEFVTREEGCRLAQERLGVPLKLSTLEKAACAGDGPQVAAKYGKRLLYRPDEFLAWVQSRVEIIGAEAA